MRKECLSLRYQMGFFKASGAVLLALVAIPGCGGNASTTLNGPAAGPESLVLAGALRAESSAANGSGNCTWTPSVFGLEYTSSTLQNGISLSFKGLVGIGGIGDIEAATPPAADGATPLVLHTGGKILRATQGTIHVAEANLSGRIWKGTIDADFEDGTHAAGGWACSAPL